MKRDTRIILLKNNLEDLTLNIKKIQDVIKYEIEEMLDTIQIIEDEISEWENSKEQD